MPENAAVNPYGPDFAAMADDL